MALATYSVKYLSILHRIFDEEIEAVIYLLVVQRSAYVSYADRLVFIFLLTHVHTKSLSKLYVWAIEIYRLQFTDSKIIKIYLLTYLF